MERDYSSRVVVIKEVVLFLSSRSAAPAEEDVVIIKGIDLSSRSVVETASISAGQNLSLSQAPMK